MDDLVVWVADIGSVKNNRFGWCRSMNPRSMEEVEKGTDIEEMVNKIVNDLASSGRVAFGLECPLFVPVASDPLALTNARSGEGSRPWSAGAGSAALATGLTEMVWIFERMREVLQGQVKPTFEWSEFSAGGANLFVWEAFVSGPAKSRSHQDDACVAARSFWSAYPTIEEANAVRTENPFSLAGAALLRARLSEDLSLLSKACIVVKS